MADPKVNQNHFVNEHDEYDSHEAKHAAPADNSTAKAYFGSVCSYLCGYFLHHCSDTSQFASSPRIERNN